jgi:hypothetical protein
MSAFTRKIIYSTAAACLALTFAASPAFAATYHKHHTKTHHGAHHIAKGSTVVRIAQRHLANLGYYMGKIDGVMGPGTKAAIKRFQREHGLIANGTLNTKTTNALATADHPVYGSRATMLTQGIANGSDVTATNNDYATTMNGGTKTISSRFARVDVSESGSGGSKRYNVNLNGQAILVADGQPSVVGISPTYDLGNEDAVVFTTYSPDSSGCIYRNHVLALNNDGSRLMDIDNCTREFQARPTNGSLFITFPQHDSNSAIGATYRVEGLSLQKL